MGETTKLIGIDVINDERDIGSIFISIVIVENDFFRKFSWLPLKSIKRVDINSTVERTMKNITDYYIGQITPDRVNKGTITEDIMKEIMQGLNTFPKFWENKIYINIDESELPILLAQMPKNMKQNITKMKIDKWKLGFGAKIVTLANRYALYQDIIERNNIISVWGDFGSGTKSDEKTYKFILDNPECPHIRQ